MRTTAFIMTDANDVTLQSEDFTFDALNRRDEVHLADGTYWKYTYDDKGNLKSAVKKDDQGNDLSDYNFNYTYDDIGNRLSASESTPSNPSTVSTTYTPNSLNQYSQISVTGNPLQELQYDVNGNILGDGSWYYIWDAENRLAAQYDQGESLLIEYIYDHRNFRVAKKVWEIGTGWTNPGSIGAPAVVSGNLNLGPQLQHLTTEKLYTIKPHRLHLRRFPRCCRSRLN